MSTYWQRILLLQLFWSDRVQGQTPVWALVPLVATYTMDGRQEEGYGITPDIDVDLDINLYSGKKNDTQLDRALEYIRTGK